MNPNARMKTHTSQSARLCGVAPRDRRNDLLARFGGDLEALRIACGKPSYAQLRRTSAALPPATTSDVLRGKSNPRIEFVIAFVEACRAHATMLGLEEPAAEADRVRWQQRWCELQLDLRPATCTDGTALHDGPDGSPNGSPSHDAAATLLVRAAQALGPNEDVEAADRILLLAGLSAPRLALTLRTTAMVHLHHLLGESEEAKLLLASLRERAGETAP